MMMECCKILSPVASIAIAELIEATADTSTDGVYELALESQRSFLSLAPELRNAIYEAVIASHDLCTQPILFRTCRQIRAEALVLFYSTHCFHLRALDVCWLESIVPAYFPYICKVAFPVEAKHRAPDYSDWSAVIALLCTRTKDGRWTAEFSRDDIRRRDVLSMKIRLKSLKIHELLELSVKVPPKRVLFHGIW